jgi:hypothetical protein
MYNFYLGRDVGYKKNAVPKNRALKVFAELLAKADVYGFTCIEAVGLYNLKVEKTFIFQVSGIDKKAAIAIAAQLAEHFKQESVLVVRNGKNWFVTPENTFTKKCHEFTNRI